MQRKRKQPPTQNLVKTAKEKVTKYPPIFGMPNYLPAREASEDDKSIEAHKKWLQAEGTKKRPNYEEVEARMTLTFSERRNAVIKENIPIGKLKEQYPWLFKDDGIEVCIPTYTSTYMRRTVLIHGTHGTLHKQKTFVCSFYVLTYGKFPSYAANFPLPSYY